MIIFHGALVGTNLLVWGEGAATGTMTTGARGRPPEAAPAPEHPWAVHSDQLLATVKSACRIRGLSKRALDKAIIWLPSRGHNPIPSGPLAGDAPKSRARLRLGPWHVTSIRLTPQQTVDLLCASVNRTVLAPGVIIGPDLAYWVVAMRFAGALVARQRYLPDVEADNTTYRARYRPVITGEDRKRLSTLSLAMPPASRAMGHDAGSPPLEPTIDVLSRFVEMVVDNLVRSSAGSGRVTPSPKKSRPSFDSLHEQWLYALASADGTMTGRRKELAEFQNQVRRWQQPLTVSETSPFRLCFQLVEPETVSEAEDRWQVRYMLQAVDDPSLLIPAQKAWTAKGRAASVIEQRGFDAREYLLASLGQASGICPRIEASLKDASPAGYLLDTPGAHEFLSNGAAALEQAGFGLFLPAWWTGKGTKTRLGARAVVRSPKMQGGGGLSLDQIVHFDWQVALGGETLTLSELKALAKLKVPLVKVRGQWVQLGAEEIQTALRFWRDKNGRTTTVRDVVKMALGSSDTPWPIDFEGVTAIGWVDDLLSRLEGEAKFEELGPPSGFQGTLRPYQLLGYSWLWFLRRWGLGACLADDMGLGKTVQTLAMIQRDRWQDGGGKPPVLLVCPTSVVENWRKEARRFTPELPVMVHYGPGRSRGKAFEKRAGESALVVTTYALLHRDIKTLSRLSWLGLILDEAQNIKNPETKQAKAARSLTADYRIALTGTPVENNVGDLWSIMEFLNPGFLSSQAEFKKRFFIPIQANRDAEAASKLKRLTRPFVMRRLKTDKSIVPDLPRKMEMKVFCPLTKEQASLYEAVGEEAMKNLEGTDGIQRKGVILALLSKLKQVCNHPRQFLGDNSPIPGRSGKLTRLMEMLEEVIEVEDRALVFTQFAQMGGILQRHLQEAFGREVIFLHGGITKKRRDQMIERFQSEDSGLNIFILSLKAGGTGLNLTQASHVFHFDRWWNPAVENQATDRAFRIGQTKNVQVYKFVCAGTLEERIDEMIERKKEVAEEVVGAGDSWLTEFSDAELNDLLTLRAEALAE